MSHSHTSLRHSQLTQQIWELRDNADYSAALAVCADDNARTTLDVKHAAVVVLSQLHAFLEPLQGTHLTGQPKKIAFEDTQLAKQALQRHYPTKAVHRIRHETSNGTPLLVCYGTTNQQIKDPELRRHLKARADRLAVTIARLKGRDVSTALKDNKTLHTHRFLHGDGCGIVTPDSMKRLDQTQCAKCRLSETDRRSKLERQLKDQYARDLWPIAPGSGMYTGTCRSCGEPFTATKPQTGRTPATCPECRRR